MSLWDLMQLAGPSRPLRPVTSHSLCFSPASLPVRGLFQRVSFEGLLGFCTWPCVSPSAVLFTFTSRVRWFPSPALICFPCPRLLQVTVSLLRSSIRMIIQNFHSACARLTLFPSTPVPRPIRLVFYPLLSSLFLSLSFKLAEFKQLWELSISAPDQLVSDWVPSVFDLCRFPSISPYLYISSDRTLAGPPLGHICVEANASLLVSGPSPFQSALPNKPG